MAPALSSNSFIRNTGLRPKPEPKLPKQLHSTVVHARQNLFGLGKPKEEEKEGEKQAGATPKKFRPFFVDIDIPGAKNLIPVVSSPSTSLLVTRRRKDPQTVFVAGATGQAGIRIAQSLLRQGFTVRAGVSDLPSAQELARIATTYKVISPAEAKRLNAVESSFSKPEAIAKAIGPATKVVVTIGPTEKGPTTAVTTDEALQVVRAAELAGVSHVVVIYDVSSVLPGSSTYNVIDGITSFFSNLFAQSQPLTISEFLLKVVETDVSYTLIKTALTEDYSPKSSHALVVSSEGSGALGGTTEFMVARSQIAALVADVFSNTSVAENKVVEVCTSASATTKPVAELFSAIAEDGRRKEYQEAVAKAKEEEAALLASQKAREAEEAAEKLEKVKNTPLSILTRKKGETATATATATESETETEETTQPTIAVLETSFKEFTGKFSSGDFSWDKLSSQLASAVSVPKTNGEGRRAEKPKAQIATVRGQAKARKLPPQKAVIKQAPQRPKPKPKQPDPKPEVKSVFGLFKQETIYVDDD